MSSPETNFLPPEAPKSETEIVADKAFEARTTFKADIRRILQQNPEQAEVGPHELTQEMLDALGKFHDALQEAVGDMPMDERDLWFSYENLIAYHAAGLMGLEKNEWNDIDNMLPYAPPELKSEWEPKFDAIWHNPL